jgi:hypothetical protein
VSARPGFFTYNACGLWLASDAPIPGLHRVGGDVPADVTISTRTASPLQTWKAGSPWYVSPGLDPSGKPEVLIEKNEEGYRVTYCDDTTFVIDRNGHHISMQWSPALAGADAASYLTSYVLAFALRLRGSVPLHASAVAIDGRARLFVGDSWAGKSSTAAAFSILGYPVLSDDIVRVDVVEGGLAACPSHPRLNVWHDSATALYSPDGLPLHSDTFGKYFLDLDHAGYAFQATPVPIAAVYLLGGRSAAGESPATRALPPRDALVALVGHTYGSAFLDRSMRAGEFDVLCRLVDEVPVRELTFSDDLGGLVSSCRDIADDRPDPRGNGGPKGPARHAR